MEAMRWSSDNSSLCDAANNRQFSSFFALYGEFIREALAQQWDKDPVGVKRLVTRNHNPMANAVGLMFRNYRAYIAEIVDLTNGVFHSAFFSPSDDVEWWLESTELMLEENGIRGSSFEAANDILHRFNYREMYYALTICDMKLEYSDEVANLFTSRARGAQRLALTLENDARICVHEYLCKDIMNLVFAYIGDLKMLRCPRTMFSGYLHTGVPYSVMSMSLFPAVASWKQLSLATQFADPPKQFDQPAEMSMHTDGRRVTINLSFSFEDGETMFTAKEFCKAGLLVGPFVYRVSTVSPFRDDDTRVETLNGWHAFSRGARCVPVL